jgi:hypothetical protein
MRALAMVAALGLLLVAAFAAAAGWLVRPDAERRRPRAVGGSLVGGSLPPGSLVPETIRVDLEEVVGADAAIEVTDESFTLAEAVSGTPADGGSVTEGTVAAEAVAGDPPASS